jgi:hypothetical protein
MSNCQNELLKLHGQGLERFRGARGKTFPGGPYDLIIVKREKRCFTIINLVSRNLTGLRCFGGPFELEAWGKEPLLSPLPLGGPVSIYRSQWSVPVSKIRKLQIEGDTSALKIQAFYHYIVCTAYNGPVSKYLA